jgi:DNA repair protein RadC
VCYCVPAIPIKVLDPIIIGENRYFSFADAGLVEEYNSDFLSLKEGKRAYAGAELNLSLSA